MALKDWKLTYLGKTLVRYEHKKSGSKIYAIPTIKDKINGGWKLKIYGRDFINYRGKSEVKKGMISYMRSH